MNFEEGSRMDDPYQLERFVVAQDFNETYEQAVSELRAGRKMGHWIWFIFPQIAGLGHSSMSRKFAISSLAEAQAYLRHSMLGSRLIRCTQILIDINGKSATDIFGSTDAMKLRSSMTLFMNAAPTEPIFREVLAKYFRGSPDHSTLVRL
jgi:uncharacterized protein (DUF1810 family)